MELQRLINEVRELMGIEEPPDPDEAEEAAPDLVKRRDPGGKTQRMGRRCPPGSHMVGGKCVRVPPAKLKKLARMKAKWGRSGAGKRSARRSAKRQRILNK